MHAGPVGPAGNTAVKEIPCMQSQPGRGSRDEHACGDLDRETKPVLPRRPIANTKEADGDAPGLRPVIPGFCWSPLIPMAIQDSKSPSRASMPSADASQAEHSQGSTKRGYG